MEQGEVEKQSRARDASPKNWKKFMSYKNNKTKKQVKVFFLQIWQREGEKQSKAKDA